MVLLPDGSHARVEQKPVRLVMELIRRYVPPGGTVVDLFMGTCTTARAAMHLNVNCWGWEKDPECFKAGETSVVNTYYSIHHCEKGSAPLQYRANTRSKLSGISALYVFLEEDEEVDRTVAGPWKAMENSLGCEVLKERVEDVTTQVNKEARLGGC